MNNRYSPQDLRAWHERRFHPSACVVPPPVYHPSPFETAMENRYGRHGSHAWKKWHERRYPRSSSCSDNNAYDVIVHVKLPPVKAERIIFIMSDDEYLNEVSELGDKGLSTFADQSRFSAIHLPQNTDEMQSSPQNEMVSAAKTQARKDAKEIKRLIVSGKPVRVIWDKVDSETDGFAEKAMEDIFSRRRQTPDDLECDRLIKVFQNAYREHLMYRLENDPVEYSETEKEDKLRETAITDSKMIPADRPYHKRDLAIVRAILYLNLRLDVVIDDLAEGSDFLAEGSDFMENQKPDERFYSRLQYPSSLSHCLAEIHQCADKYEKYFSNPRKEVIWPDCRVTFPYTR